MKQLAQIAKDDPNACYVAYTKGLCHRWAFTQRTIGDIQSLFSPLERAIREKLLSALVGREVNNKAREMLALPVRFGGIGIQDPTKTAQSEYENPMKITVVLTENIYEQSLLFNHQQTQ